MRAGPDFAFPPPQLEGVPTARPAAEMAGPPPADSDDSDSPAEAPSKGAAARRLASGWHARARTCSLSPNPSSLAPESTSGAVRYMAKLHCSAGSVRLSYSRGW